MGMRQGAPEEWEARPAVSITLAALPGVTLRSCHVAQDALPDAGTLDGAPRLQAGRNVPSSYCLHASKLWRSSAVPCQLARPAACSEEQQRRHETILPSFPRCPLLQMRRRSRGTSCWGCLPPETCPPTLCCWGTLGSPAWMSCWRGWTMASPQVGPAAHEGGQGRLFLEGGRDF